VKSEKKKEGKYGYMGILVLIAIGEEFLRSLRLCVIYSGYRGKCGYKGNAGIG